MKLFTQEQHARLLKNGSPEQTEEDHLPVVKWFTPDASCTWLITELVDEETAFGLCDLGMGCPELGYISVEEIKTVRGKLGLPIERDRFFEAKHPLSVYFEAAKLKERITENETELQQAEACLKNNIKL